jgi:hypothetical protein
VNYVLYFIQSLIDEEIYAKQILSDAVFWAEYGGGGGFLIEVQIVFVSYRKVSVIFPSVFVSNTIKLNTYTQCSI